MKILTPELTLAGAMSFSAVFTLARLFPRWTGFGLLAFGTLVRLCAQPAAPAQVGELGRLDGLIFHGERTFTVQQIKDGLAQSPDYLLAAHPAAPFADFMKQLPALVKAGYQAHGFSNPNISAALQPDAGAIRVDIDEGPRYKKAEILVRGALPFPKEELVRRLIGPWRISPLAKPPFGLSEAGVYVGGATAGPNQPSGENPPEPFWKRGDFAEFNQVAMETASLAVTNALADFGYLFPKFAVRVVPRPRQGLADLEVNIADLGKKQTIGAIEISGNRKNSREEILQRLNLREGAPLNGHTVDEIHQALARSGRFLGEDVAIERGADDASKSTLKIELHEYDPLPSLSSAVSPQGEALLRFCDWLNRFSKRDEELRLSVVSKTPPLALEMVLSPKSGVFISARDAGASAALPKRMILLSPAGCVFYSQANGKFAAPPLAVATSVSGTADASRPEDPFHINFAPGIFYRPNSNTASAPVLKTSFEPVALLHLAYSTNYSVTLTNGVLTARSQDAEISAEAASGKFISFHLQNTNVTAHAELATNLFAAKANQLDRVTAGLTNQFDPRRPVSSPVSYLAAELLDWNAPFLPWKDLSPDQRRRAGAAMKQFIGAGCLAPLDDLFRSLATNRPAESFNIPLLETPTQPLPAMIAMIAGAAGRFFDQNFPEGSWPATLARESVFVLMGKPRYTGAELQRLYGSDQTGPIGFFCVAKGLQLIGQIQIARQFALKGLAHLETEDFEQDCQLLFRPGSAPRKIIEGALASLRTLDAEDWEALEAAAPQSARSFLIALRTSLRTHDPADDANFAQELLDQWWNASLKARLRGALLEILKPQPVPKRMRA